MSEFIGSRISLISKSDIRYVGTLHEISSESSTVALENVKSFGTEGRRAKPEEEIAASDELYEYIVFRGSDVKDLRIEEAPKEVRAPAAPVPNDPAILGSGPRPAQPENVPGPRQGGSMQQPPFPYSQPPYNPQYPPQRFGGPQPPHMGYGVPPQGSYPGYGGQGYPGGPGFYGPPGPGFPPHAGAFSPPQAQGPQQNNGPPFKSQASQHQSDADTGNKPLVRDQSVVKPSQEPLPVVEQTAHQHGETAAPRPPLESKPNIAIASHPEPPQAAPKSLSNGRVALPRTPALPRGTNGPALGQPIQSGATANAALQYQSSTQAATAAVAAAMAKLPPTGHSKPLLGGGPSSFDQLAQKVQEMRVDDRTRGADRGGARGRGRRGGAREPAKAMDVPATDFDFASANAKFNKQDLIKEAIASGSPVGATAPELTAHGADTTTPNNGPVTIPAASATPYSKTSFFDNISSEAKEREEAADGHRRPGGAEFRNEERRKNLETFGLGSVDNRYGGGYRGRGRGRGRARGSSFRGGRGQVSDGV